MALTKGSKAAPSENLNLEEDYVLRLYSQLLHIHRFLSTEDERT